MAWKTLLPRGVELKLTWRGSFRFMDDPQTERQAVWDVIVRVHDPIRFVLSGRGDLRGTFAMEPDIEKWPVAGRIQWLLQETREVLHDASFEKPDGSSWHIVGRRPLELKGVNPGLGHMHCQLLEDEKVVAVGVLTTDMDDWTSALKTLRILT